MSVEEITVAHRGSLITFADRTPEYPEIGYWIDRRAPLDVVLVYLDRSPRRLWISAPDHPAPRFEGTRRLVAMSATDVPDPMPYEKWCAWVKDMRRREVQAALEVARRVMAGETRFTKFELQALALITVHIIGQDGRRVVPAFGRAAKRAGGGGS